MKREGLLQFSHVLLINLYWESGEHRPDLHTLFPIDSI
jgi:hypothetical protein